MNANNAFLPPDFNPTLNHRFVYRPYFGMVDTEKKTGKLTLTYATQVHACVVEIDKETGATEIVDYGAVDDCGIRIHPQIVEGQVHGATAHAIGAALHEDFVYDEDGTLLTANFYDYHVPHALDMSPERARASPSPSSRSRSRSVSGLSAEARRAVSYRRAASSYASRSRACWAARVAWLTAAAGSAAGSA